MPVRRARVVRVRASKGGQGQGQFRQGEGGQGQKGGGMRVGRMQEEILAKLNLSAEQKTKIEALNKRLQAEVQKLMQGPRADARETAPADGPAPQGPDGDPDQGAAGQV